MLFRAGDQQVIGFYSPGEPMGLEGLGDGRCRRLSAWPRSALSSSGMSRDPLQLHLPMSRFDIGSYLSLVIETVSRGLSKLQDDGVISVKGRHLGVLEPAVLARLAHGE